MKQFITNYINNDIDLNKRQKIGIFCFIVATSGVFGFLYEFIFYFFNSGMKEFYYRGGNFLPWINIYAYGAILIILLTYKKRKKPLQVFLIGVVSSGILEYIGGALMARFSDVRCWNYNEEILNFGNINGYVCLRSVVFFGLSGLLLLYAMLPFFIWLSKKMNDKTFMTIGIVICSIFLIDEIYNLVITRLFNLPHASDIYKQHGFKYKYFTK